MEQAAAFARALGRTHAVATLLFLYKQSPRGSTEITRYIGGAASSGIRIARHLERCGLAEIRPGPNVAGKPTYRIGLTPAGGRIAEGLSQLVAFMP